MPFFLLHSAVLGRSLHAARGFFETLIPVYDSQLQNSALSLAVSAVAGRVFALWHHDYHGSAELELHLAPYTRAAASVRHAIAHPEQRHKPATVLAVLAMHLYENISAIFHLRPATSVHHDGALALLPVILSTCPDGTLGAYVQYFVLHLETSSALRQKRRVQSNLQTYITNRSGDMVVPRNISSALDSIGVDVANLQADFERTLASYHTLESQRLPSREWDKEVEGIDEHLRAWVRSVPPHLIPLRAVSGQDFCPSIPCYQSACDLYASCQLATIWNLWRIQRIIILKIMIRSAQLDTVTSAVKSASGDQSMRGNTGIPAQFSTIQELIDGICYSIPFYLGNRNKPSSLADFDNDNMTFPSHHSLATECAKVSARRRDGDGTAMYQDEHQRHVVANGAWHAMSPLSSLLTIFSDDAGGRLIAGALRPGQRDWIREQFMRVHCILRLPDVGARLAADSLGASEYSTSVFSSTMASERSVADHLAERVRKGAAYMSGP